MDLLKVACRTLFLGDNGTGYLGVDFKRYGVVWKQVVCQRRQRIQVRPAIRLFICGEHKPRQIGRGNGTN